ncbi:MAG: hypothetical protein ACKPKO_23675, partial [Candidatus Fonsibacter sp.]
DNDDDDDDGDQNDYATRVYAATSPAKILAKSGRQRVAAQAIAARMQLLPADSMLGYVWAWLLRKPQPPPQ